jgi:hypothetical protein
VGELDGLDDFETMGLKGEALVEDGTEVEEFGDLGDGEGAARERRWVGDSWKTTILDLREEIVKRLRSQEVWEEWMRPYMEERVWVMRVMV